MNRPSRRLAAALALSLLLAGCRKADDGTIRLNGRIEAPTVDLAPKVAGRVVEVRVREGDRVSQGDLLVLLDLGEVRAVARIGEEVERDHLVFRVQLEPVVDEVRADETGRAGHENPHERKLRRCRIGGN